MDKNTLIFNLISSLLFAGILTFSYVNTTDIAEEEFLADIELPQVVKPVKLKDTYFWAGEEIPKNADTRERIDRELLVNSYWQSSTLLNLKMANKYFPTIERILAEQGVPDDFKYLAVAESNLRNVTSSAAAKGYWQFRKLAGKEWGLEINKEVDERYHIEKATLAAAKYIKWLKSKFGTWSNAAAAYNVGPTNFSRLQKSQGEYSYFNMNINEETSRYLFRLIAIKEIMKDPQRYGFYVDQEDLYPPLDATYTVMVDKSVPSWKKFASNHGVSYRELKFYNPWLIDGKLTVKKKTYYIRIPKNS